MSKPFHYKPLSEVIAEYEKDPEKKKFLDAEREKAAAWMSSLAEIQPIEFDLARFIKSIPTDVRALRHQLAQDIDEAIEQDD